MQNKVEVWDGKLPLVLSVGQYVYLSKVSDPDKIAYCGCVLGKVNGRYKVKTYNSSHTVRIHPRVNRGCPFNYEVFVSAFGVEDYRKLHYSESIDLAQKALSTYRSEEAFA